MTHKTATKTRSGRFWVAALIFLPCSNGVVAVDDNFLLDLIPSIVANKVMGTPPSPLPAPPDPAIDPEIDFGTIIRSSDLGWVPGADVSDEIEALFDNGVVKPNTTLLLEGMFDIQGSVRLDAPNNFVLAGNQVGNGLTIRNTEATLNNPWLRLGGDNALYNVEILHTETKSLNDGNGKSNTRSIQATEDNIKIINSYFEGNLGLFIDAAGKDHLVLDTHFNGASAQIRALNVYQSPKIINSLFENALADGIKTIRPPEGDLGTEQALVSGCVFLNNARDGIDTTGGFRDSLVEDSYFVGLFKGMDIKNIYDQNTRVFANQNLQSLNKNITVRRSEFINNNNGIASITLDRGPSGDGSDRWITNQNAANWLTNTISVTNTIFENTGSGRTNALLSQDVFNVSWNSILLLGNVNMSRVSRNSAVSSQVDPSVNTNYNIDGSNVSTGPIRTMQPDAYYRSLAGRDQSLQFDQ